MIAMHILEEKAAREDFERDAKEHNPRDVRCICDWGKIDMTQPDGSVRVKSCTICGGSGLVRGGT